MKMCFRLLLYIFCCQLIFAQFTFAENLEISACVGGQIIFPATTTGTFANGTNIPIEALTDSGYQFKGWFGDGSQNIANPRLPQTSITMNSDARIYAAYSPLAGNKINNGYFDSSLDSWTSWTVTGFPSVQISDAESVLEVSGTGFSGGAWQQIETGGVGHVVTMTGWWRGSATTAVSAFGEVWIINENRTPQDGVDETDGTNNAQLLFRATNNAGWQGAIAKTTSGVYQISFIANAANATLILKAGNDGSSASEVSFDMIEMRSTPAPGNSLDDVPEGFSMRTMVFPRTFMNKMAEHPITGDIYSARGFTDKNLFKVDVSTSPMTAVEIEQLNNLGYYFGNQYVSGLTFLSQGDLFVCEHDGQILRGTYDANSDTFTTWALVIDLQAILGLSPVGDHGFGEMAIDENQQKIYIGYGALVRGRGNTEPETDNGYNLRIFKMNLDGSNFTEICQGIRYDHALTLRRDGKLFGTENSGPCHSAEEIHFIEQGRHFGYPFNYSTENSGNDTGNFTCEQTPVVGGPFSPGLVNFGPHAKPEPGEPGYTDGGLYWGLHPHSSPNGMAFYEPELMNPDANLFPEEYHGRAFIVRYGRSVSDSPDVGFDLISVRIDDYTQSFTANYFMRWVGRPLHVMCHSNGNVYFTNHSTVAAGPGAVVSNTELYELKYNRPVVNEPLTALYWEMF